MQHLAIIPDGNRRWAKNNKIKAILGHKKGLEGVETAIKFAMKNHIKYLSFYIFSLENFNRPEEEKSYLFELLVEEFYKQLPRLLKEEIRVRFIGARDYFPGNVSPVILELEEKTKHLNKLNLNLLFCYGAKAELVYATKTLAQKVKAGFLNIDDINEDEISKSLWTADLPDPDLIIRTSGCARLSNFLLYQAAYSEFMFLDCYWPEITEDHFNKCLQDFNNIKRNFGK